MSEIMAIYKIQVPKFTLDKHSGKRYPNGHKIFYVIRGEKESYSQSKLESFYNQKRQSEFTDNSVRDWFQGKVEMTVLMAEELGSHSLQGDLQAYLIVNRHYQEALNVLPPIVRQTQYYKPAYKRMSEMQGNTVSRAILEWQLNKAAHKIQVEKDRLK